MIEKLIEENTAALVRLTAAIDRVALLTDKAEVAAGKKPVTGESSSGTAKEPPASSALVDTGGTDVPSPVTQELLTAKFMLLMKAKGNSVAKSVLDKFKVPKLSVIPEAKWVEVDVEIEKALV